MYRRADAQRLYATALDIRRRALGNEHVQTLRASPIWQLVPCRGQVRRGLRRSHRGSGDHARESTGGRTAETLVQGESARHCLSRPEEYKLAEPLALSAARRPSAHARRDKHGNRTAEEEVAALHLSQGRLDEALRTCRERWPRDAAAADRRTCTCSGRCSAGRVHLQRHEYADAERLFRHASAGFTNAAIDKWRPAVADSLLARALAAQGKHEEAEPLLSSACQRLAEHQSAIPRDNWFLFEEARQALADLRRLRKS